MTTTKRLSTCLPLLRTAAVAAACVAASPSFALYKVVGPDGKITYTDRAPSSSEGKISPIGGRQAAEAETEVALPLELRQAVSRFPVTLYTVGGACDPCDVARALLRQRGVPHRERLVVSAEDGEAFQKLSGGRDAPTLTIGAQMLRGLSPDTWNAYLDSAGYPRESRLPPAYQHPPATPLTERREAAPARPAPAAAAAAPQPVTPPPAEGTIRF